MSTFVGIPRLPSPPVDEIDPEAARPVRMACSLLLDYPSEDFEERLGAVEAETGSMPAEAGTALARFCTIARERGVRTMQEQYVETFDQRRRCALGLTYYTHGDTRDRGQALLAFKEVLRSSGFETAREELPDHLPLVLEFCALDTSGNAEALLRSNREGIEVIRTALRSSDSPWQHVLDALVSTLPAPDAATMDAYRRLLRQGPPTELVGVGDLASTPSPVPGTVQER